MNCTRCGTLLPSPPTSRRDTCLRCGADLHACVQCVFYAPGSYNDCREPQADRVTEKERANFCDWFEPGSGVPASTAKDDARAKLDALFKKS